MAPKRIKLDLSKVEYSSYPQRIGARICDSILVAALFVGFIYASGNHFIIDTDNLDPKLGIGNLIYYIPLFAFAYEVPLMASQGLTIGKRIFGICVVRADGLIGIGLDRAFTRFIVPQAIGVIPLIGVFAQITAQAWFLFDPERQNVADKVARTFVIRIPPKDQSAIEQNVLEDNSDNDIENI